jgi:hypothetical protein
MLLPALRKFQTYLACIFETNKKKNETVVVNKAPLSTNEQSPLTLNHGTL